MWFVYVLSSIKCRKSYVGSTNNIKRRLSEHNNGESTYTKRFAPWTVIYFEEFQTFSEARKKEKFYKTSWGRKKLKAIFNKNL